MRSKNLLWLLAAPAALLPFLLLADAPGASVITGKAAFRDFKDVTAGTFRKITAADLPEPFATPSASNGSRTVPRPEGAWPVAPPGFKVEQYATGMRTPRELRIAPNGDLFVAEQGGAIRVFRGIGKDGKPERSSTFATGLIQPFGIGFYPPGTHPQWIYIGNTNGVVKFPYKNGDLAASGPSQIVVPELPRGGGHWTRDLAFTADGKKMFVAVGSGSNIDDPDTHPAEFHRANILEFTPEGQFVKIYASGIRNPVGIAINPVTGALWCSVNERDELGDNLVPDYITSVKEGGFYGWPYFYVGPHPDPRLGGKHPELRNNTIVPDVLLNPHNASLQLTFYSGKQFPKDYQGDIFAGEHGSWNRKPRTGYEVVRVPLKNGHAGGEFEDFLTGFVNPDGSVWGRPVGVATAPDGTLFVSDDGSNSIWRVIWTGK